MRSSGAAPSCLQPGNFSVQIDYSEVGCTGSAFVDNVIAPPFGFACRAATPAGGEHLLVATGVAAVTIHRSAWYAGSCTNWPLGQSNSVTPVTDLGAIGNPAAPLQFKPQ